MNGFSVLLKLAGWNRCWAAGSLLLRRDRWKSTSMCM